MTLGGAALGGGREVPGRGTPDPAARESVALDGATAGPRGASCTAGMRRRRRGIQACRGPIYSGSTPTLASKTSLGDFDKCCKMRIYVQKSASIQLRTGSLKELLPRPPHALGRQRLYSFQCQRHRGFPPFQPSAQPLSRGLHPASPPRPRQPGAPRACRLSAVCGPT